MKSGLDAMPLFLLDHLLSHLIQEFFENFTQILEEVRPAKPEGFGILSKFLKNSTAI